MENQQAKGPGPEGKPGIGISGSHDSEQRALVQSVSIPVEKVKLYGDLTIPEGATGIVLFALAALVLAVAALAKYVFAG